MSLTIQNLIFYPHSLELSHLYIRGNNYILLDENTIKIKSFSSIAFDTYYNIFSLKKWIKYCNLEELYLEFDFIGDIQVNLVGVNKRNTFYTYEKDIYQEEFSSDTVKHICISLTPNIITDIESLYLTVRANSKDSTISNICFTTQNIIDNNSYKLGCCICTFNRQEYIKNTISTIKSGNKKYNLNLEVVITNNGAPIDLILEDRYINIYSSRNMGGAGGFTHSIYNAIQKECTHLLLMDDDISFNFESIFRAYRFFQLIKPEFYDVVLSGSMFSADERWLRYERNTILDKNGFHHQGHFEDMRDRSVIIDDVLSESIPDTVYGLSGWWFSAFSKKIIDEYGYPLPIFVRGDDIEFSMRINKEIVSINGVNVWHDPFILKYNEIMEDYYLSRNMIINSLLSYSRCYELIKIFSVKKFLKNLITFNYIAAEFNILALQHIIEGKYSDDPEHIHQWAMKKLKELKSNTIIIEKAHYFYTKPKFNKKITKILGILLSFTGFGTKGTSKAGFERRPIFFYGRNRVLVFNTLNNTMEECVLDRKITIKLIYRFLKNYIHFIKNIEYYREQALLFRSNGKTKSNWELLFKKEDK
ncbi:hypothetical protein P375_03690 [Gallibacterium genomosp. 2]|uniref:Glycosyltransferase 2-like domain-containing protein n=1 Tax=Gallibacterium genomosp. 2 TaxID=155517 RepID=A0A0A2XLT7_9PAST|nr:glycosyltransferase [Gallibacterium genomosp. 2]KGQ33306.1 hypothetical protein P375_03690 [Gallibacterium genomosp. 2]